MTAPLTSQQARRAIAMLDLTSLGDADTPEMIDALCRRAVNPAGTAVGAVAAVCVWPRFVGQARARLAGTAVRVATVANFPHGDGDAAAVAREVAAAVADGAQEVDVVLPWRRFQAGDGAHARDLLAASRAACGDAVLMKVILESGAFDDLGQLREAADLALDCGADFLKTSTGKREPGATLAAGAVFCDAIQAAGRGGQAGIKASGGVRTARQAAEWLNLVERRMGADWAGPARFRFGASALLDALAPLALATDGEQAP